MHPALLLIPGGAILGGLAWKYNWFGAKDKAASAPTTPAKTNAPASPATAQSAAASVAAALPPPQPPPPPAGAPVQPKPSSKDPTKATVTTNDPPPSGDLKVMAAPTTSSTQTGGAEKDGTVDVITWNAGEKDGFTWSYIRWGGGKRWPSVQGYVKQKYLKPGG